MAVTGFQASQSQSGAKLPFHRVTEGAIRHAFQEFGAESQNRLKPFSDLYKEIGGTPSTFTDIPESAYLTPQRLSEMTNSLFAEGAARTANQQNQIQRSMIPGATSRFGLSEMLAAPQRFNDALAQREATALAGQYSPTINRLAAEAQTNVEAQRAADDRYRRQLAIQRMRDQMARENYLLQGIADLGRALPFSKSSSIGVQYAPEEPLRGNPGD